MQDIRIGGLLLRVDSCRRRLLDYASGKIDAIPELAVKILPEVIPERSYKTYGKIVTPNRLTDLV